MNSNDMFDFEGYLNQFKCFDAKTAEFMEKLINTQCFNIFIEETHKLLTCKDPESAIKKS